MAPDTGASSVPAEVVEDEPKPTLTDADAEKIVMMVREHCKKNWTDDQIIHAGVLIICIDDAGYLSMTNSPNLKAKEVLKVALMNELAGNFDVSKVGEGGIRDLTEAERVQYENDPDTVFADDTRALVEDRQKNRKKD